MKFKEISHSQSLETVDQWGLKHWYKSGVTVEIESQDEVDRAAKLAEQFVNEQLDKYKLTLPEKKVSTKVELSQEVKSTVEAILQCPTEEQLKSEFWVLSKGNLNYASAYSSRLKQLTDGTK